jgi:hypothetical protein
MSTLNNDLGPSLTLTSQGAGTVTAPYDVNPTHRGVIVVVNITAITAGSLTVSIIGHDPVSDTDFTLLSSAALSGTGQTVLTVYPGCTAAANSVANAPIPNVWSIKAVVATGPVTATISSLTCL